MGADSEIIEDNHRTESVEIFSKLNGTKFVQSNILNGIDDDDDEMEEDDIVRPDDADVVFTDSDDDDITAKFTQQVFFSKETPSEDRKESIEID